MKQALFIFMFLSAGTLAVSSQSSKAYFGIGSSRVIFQDTRFSDSQVPGQSITTELGYLRKSEKSYINANFRFLVSMNNPPYTSEEVDASLALNAGFSYLRNIHSGYFLGAGWDIVDYTTRTYEELHNNSNFFLTSSDLFLSAKSSYKLSEKIKLTLGIDLAAVSLMKYAPGFTANFSQNIIDQGLLSFQDISIRDPWSLEYMQIMLPGEQIYLKTHVEVFTGRKVSFAYDWTMRSIRELREYPVTMARHHLTFRYHFIRRNQ